MQMGWKNHVRGEQAWQIPVLKDCAQELVGHNLVSARKVTHGPVWAYLIVQLTNEPSGSSEN